MLNTRNTDVRRAVKIGLQGRRLGAVSDHAKLRINRGADGPPTKIVFSHSVFFELRRGNLSRFGELQTFSDPFPGEGLAAIRSFQYEVPGFYADFLHYCQWPFDRFKRLVRKAAQSISS
jgi:hypothetical protein